MNRRVFFYKVLGIISVFFSPKLRARQEFTWPSKASQGSVKKQTRELVTLLKAGFIINCRPGVFVLNNPIRINVAYVDIRGALGAEETELHFLDKNKGGLLLRGASYVNISNIHMHWDFVDKEARSHWGAGLMLIKSKNINVSFSSVHGAPGAGFHFNQSQDIDIRHLFVENTLADGIHFQNSSNCNGYDLTTNNTGDDGVAIVDYLHSMKSSGFDLEKITVIGSKARGIALVGARNGLLHDFFIDEIASNGLHIEQDVYFQTRVSENIKVFSGKINGVGQHSVLRKNNFGINLLYSCNIELEDIEINYSKRFGCFISHCKKISLSNVFIKSVKDTSIFVFNSRKIIFNNIKISGGFAPFIKLVGVTQLNASDIVIVYQRGPYLKEVIALIVSESKRMPLSNVTIKPLVLEFRSFSNSSSFIIRSNNVKNVHIDVISKSKVKVVGGKGVTLFKVFKN